MFLGLRDDGGFIAVKQIDLVENGSPEQRSSLSSVEAVRMSPLFLLPLFLLVPLRRQPPAEQPQEIALMKRLSHPNIVRYLGTDRTAHHLSILLEYVPGGSIASLIGRFGAFPERTVRRYTAQIALGLRYLHDHQIIHRGTRCRNAAPHLLS